MSDVSKEELEELYLKVTESITSLTAVQARLLQILCPPRIIDGKKEAKMEKMWKKIKR
jgi:hypothetical protein